MLDPLHYLWDSKHLEIHPAVSRPHPTRSSLPANWAGMLLQNQQSENPHLRLNICVVISSSRGVNAKMLMITMIALSRGELALVHWGDDNDGEGNLMLKMSGEVLGVSLKLCWGNEMDEDVNHVCDIQTQQALREGVDSVDSCREVVWSHPG